MEYESAAYRLMFQYWCPIPYPYGVLLTDDMNEDMLCNIQIPILYHYMYFIPLTSICLT